ncbi:MAG: DNA repair protein RecN [Gammaproteobacteria bacterium]|nr:DNA repair protein RecN [Gammaproteobacteria bacterium]
MLTHLHIQNFAIIDHTDLVFHSGMTVITGETGAGKSIILDALELVLGARAESSFLRPDQNNCEITATFDIDNNLSAKQFLEERNLNSDGECILRRVISKDNKSKAFINQRPVPLQVLRECSETLISIHGQHEHQHLISRETQRNLLDSFGQHDNLTHSLKDLFLKYQETLEIYTQQKQNLSHRDSKLDFLKFQVEELDKLNLSASELESLEQEHKQLANISKYLNAYQSVQNLLDENLLTTLSKTISLANTLPSSNLNTLLDTANIQLSEASSELASVLGNMDLNPERLNEIENRLARIHDIARKHRIKSTEIPDLHEKLKQELSALLKLDNQLDLLEKQLTEIKLDYLHIANQLTVAREKAATNMSKAITKYMSQLGMSGGKIEIQLTPNSLAENPITQHGLEKIEFLVSANPGMPLQSLSKVASGGELSRISLAIQLIATETTKLPILIFDEVDVGIGGATAEIVGQLLKQLAKNTQVICITHLPQVAAQGTHHISVSKTSTDDHTASQIKILNSEEKIQEIARMLGGVTITEQTIAHARELIYNAIP